MQVKDRIFSLYFMAQARSEKKKEKTRVRTDQTRLIRCLLHGFVDYSGKRPKPFDVFTGDQQLEVVRLLTDLKLTNHSTRNQSAI